MPCVIWISQTLQDSYNSLRNDANDSRLGQKITVPNKTICRLGFYLQKFGSPTGTLYARIRRTSDDSIVETSGDTVDVSTIPASWTWYYFTFSSLINEEVYCLVEYNQGDADNGVRVGDYVSDVISGLWVRYYNGGWLEYADRDATIKIYEEVPAVAEPAPTKTTLTLTL